MQGHYYDIYNRHGQKFHRDIAQKYGGVIKIFGWCGVCVALSAWNMTFTNLVSSKAEQLYVSDPRALHHILVKDQYTYQETGMFLAYANSFFEHDCR